MKLGTDEEIEKQEAEVAKAEQAYIHALLRLRALKGETLCKVGDSFTLFGLTEVTDQLAKEFGSRHLRMF